MLVVVAAFLIAAACANPHKNSIKAHHFAQAKAGFITQDDEVELDNINDDGCAPGYWGPYCEQTCGFATCLQFPKREDDVGIVCDKVTGLPSLCDSCVMGYWGEVCEMRCDAHHCIEDANFGVTCSKLDGTNVACSQCEPGWVGNDCSTQVTCPALPPLANGHMSCAVHEPQTHNTTCSFYCNPGFAIQGPIGVTCKSGAYSDPNGQWSADMPVCKPKSCTPHAVEGSLRACEGVTGDLCVPEPSWGYVCVGSLRCVGQEGQDSGLWLPVAETPVCTVKADCGDCDENAFCGTVSGSPVCLCRPGYFGSGHQGSCTPCSSCASGFQVEAACGVQNTDLIEVLYFHDTVCADIDECSVPCLWNEVDKCNRCNQECINQPGSFLCACRDGYHLSPDGYTCIPTTCRMHEVSHSTRACAGSVGDVCDMTEPHACEPGYWGHGSLVCSAQGAWVGSAECYPMYCSATEIAHINVERPCKESMLPWDPEFSMAVGEHCTLQCERGYKSTGKLLCAASKDGVTFTADAVCEPEVCTKEYVDVKLNVVCEGIHTGESCIGQRDFVCPAGYVALGSATCTASGALISDPADPPRCQAIPTYVDPCTLNPCKEHACISTVSSLGYECVCPQPKHFDLDTGDCQLTCPPPSFANPANTDCLFPTGFRRVVFGDHSPSAVMVGQHKIPATFRPASTVCSRIPYVNGFVWDAPPRVIASLAFGTQRTAGDAIDVLDHHAITHWVENITTAYFSFCYADVEPLKAGHDAVLVNFISFSTVYGAQYGDSAVVPLVYTTRTDDMHVHKYISFQQQFARPPLVLASISHQTTSLRGCSPLHCGCDANTHNAATLSINDIYEDSFSAQLSELEHYHTRSPREIEETIATKYCGQKQCVQCGDINCDNELAEATSMSKTRCVMGKDAVVSWLALGVAQSGGLLSGSVQLSYQRPGTDIWRFASNCYAISFQQTLENPVVFVSINRRSGENTGSFEQSTSRDGVAWHVEGTNKTGFRVCYKVLSRSFDTQPATQEGLVSVDWVAFHDV